MYDLQHISRALINLKVGASLMDYQVLFNLVVGLVGGIGGWLLNNLWLTVRDLQRADRDLADKVGSIEVLVAGKYVTRDEFTGVVATLYTKLDRILDQVSHNGK